MICKHRFVEVARHFTARSESKIQVTGVSEEKMLQMFYGFTTVESVCEKCGHIYFLTTAGDQTV